MKKQECVVQIPGLNEKKRFLIPDNMLIQEVIQLILELICEEYPDLNCEKGSLNLFKAATGEILKKSDCLEKIDVTESDELILG